MNISKHANIIFSMENVYSFLLSYRDARLVTQDDEIKYASEWSGVLSSQRVYAAVRSAKRVALASH